MDVTVSMKIQNKKINRPMRAVSIVFIVSFSEEQRKAMCIKSILYLAMVSCTQRPTRSGVTTRSRIGASIFFLSSHVSYPSSEQVLRETYATYHRKKMRTRLIIRSNCCEENYRALMKSTCL